MRGASFDAHHGATDPGSMHHQRHPEIIYQDGVHLRGTVLWLDALEARRFCFVSSGHVRQLAHHGRVLATPPTVRFLRARLGIGDALIAPFNRPFGLGPLRLELMPAGSMLGAAQLLVELDHERIVYTGWLGPVEGIDTAIRPQIRRCDRLILNTHERILETASERDAGRRALLTCIEEVHARGELPVVLCEALGLAQEVVSWCRRKRLRVRAHRTIAAFTHEYRRFGREVGHSPELRRWPGEAHGPVEADVVLYPMLLGHSPILARLPRHRLIVAWSGLPDDRLYPEACHVPNVNCHASLEDLVVYARCARAREIVVVGAWARELASALRATGCGEVTELRPPEQGELWGDALTSPPGEEGDHPPLAAPLPRPPPLRERGAG